MRRLGGLDTPVPFSPPLEDAYRPDAEKIYQAARSLARDELVGAHNLG